MPEDKTEDTEDPEPQERSFAVEGNDLSGYVGVSPEYATYANETEAPLKGEGDDEDAKAREEAASTDVPEGVETPDDRVEPQAASLQPPLPGVPEDDQPKAAAPKAKRGPAPE